MTGTTTATSTYTALDVEKVVRRVAADLKMIADSTGGWDATTTANYVHDVEELAKAGYLKHVDVSLFSNDVETKATRFVVNTDASGLANQRPGDAMWPRVANPRLRIVLTYNTSYDDAARARMASKLTIGWVSCFDDTSHSTLRRGGDRSYASNAYGMQRMDWAA